MTSTPAPSLTNSEFAKRTGVHFTMASRLRNGDRVPSLHTFTRVIKEFNLSDEQIREWLAAIESSPEESGKWLTANIFGP